MFYVFEFASCCFSQELELAHTYKLDCLSLDLFVSVEERSDEIVTDCEPQCLAESCKLGSTPAESMCDG